MAYSSLIRKCLSFDKYCLRILKESMSMNIKALVEEEKVNNQLFLID